MRIIEILNENFKTARDAFVKQGIDQGVVDKVISNFRMLAGKNQFSGDEKNIDWWVKQGWNNFQNAVETKAKTPTKTQQKTGKTDKALSVSFAPNELSKSLGVTKIVMPLNYLGSRACGKNSNFCTTKLDRTHYDHIVLDQNSVLFYFLKNTPEGEQFYAVSTGPNYTLFWNHDNDEISEEEFVKQTGFKPQNIEYAIKKYSQQILNARTQETGEVSPHLYPMSTSDASQQKGVDLLDFEDWLQNPQVK